MRGWAKGQAAALGQAVATAQTVATAVVAEQAPWAAPSEAAGLDRRRTMALLDAGVLQVPEAELDP